MIKKFNEFIKENIDDQEESDFAKVNDEEETSLDDELEYILKDLVSMGLEDVPLSDERIISDRDMKDAIDRIKKVFIGNNEEI